MQEERLCRSLIGSRSTCIAILLFAVPVAALSACTADEPIDVQPVAAYEPFGQPFEPAAALPVEVVLHEADRYADTAIMVEGILRDDCRDDTCWMSMHADSLRLAIAVPRFAVSDTAAGRRAVVHGRFSSTDTTFTLDPTGVMVEKVRS